MPLRLNTCSAAIAGLVSTVALIVTGNHCSAAAASADAPVLDFRYAPTNWQTAICLPDDWQKTLVGKDGALLYDYPGPFAGFGTRIAFDLTEGSTWTGQQLDSARVPIVRTTKSAGEVEIVEEAFAVAPALPRLESPKSAALRVERVGTSQTLIGWAVPRQPCDVAFCNIRVGYGQPLGFRFPARAGERFTVVFGLCEGWHTNAAQRVLDLRVEGWTRRTVDLVGEFGRNVPATFAFEAADENGDGWVDLSVAAATGSPDKNTILNVLWVFRAGEAPDDAELLAGLGGKPALARVDATTALASADPPRHDVLLVHLRNRGANPATVTPQLTIESGTALTTSTSVRELAFGDRTHVFSTEPRTGLASRERRHVLHFAPVTLAPGAEHTLAFGVGRGDGAAEFPRDVAAAEAARKRAARFWAKLALPYGHLEVPDPSVQALLDSCIRNIYQAREIKQGLPAFQVGPTCYRGLWVVDGSFLLEAVTYLWRTNETRAGMKYLLGFQRPDGAFMLIDGHWKETGIVLWAIARHAQLTGDQEWLRSVWPNVRRGVAAIQAMRKLPPAGAPNEGLIPDGFSDGGLADKVPEYTNVYWTLAGLRAAIHAARSLGETADATAWQREYDDFYATFCRAAERDAKTDAQGNRYVPIRMAKGEGIPPQKAQWAFLHAVFPGQVFAADDPLVRGNLAMLRAVECEGLVRDTGWLKNGLWNYFGSFYAHAWLWLGDGVKAAQTLYAFGNHASPLLCWREEQMPVGEGPQMVGDMPHNWASAEFIRLVRHLIVLERGDELHLFAGFPEAWTKPGAVTRLNGVLTSFGPVSLEFRVAKNGRTAQLHLDPPRRHSPARIVWHLDVWSGENGTRDLPTEGKSKSVVPLRRP